MLMRAASASTARAQALSHNEFIAQLRGVAVVPVVLMHYGSCFPIGYVGLGYYGVVMFFAISGFLITTNILKRYGSLANVSLRDFYIMRAARILPLLVLVVALLSAMSLLTSFAGFVFEPGLSVSEAIEYLVTLRFNQYYVLGASVTMAWGVLWSISIEEAFYLLYPVTLKLFRSERLLMAMFGAVVIAGPLFRWGGYLYGYVGSDVSWRTNLAAYLGCFDLLDMGVLAAIAAHRIGHKTPAAVVRLLKWTGGAIVYLTYVFLRPLDHASVAPSLVAAGTSMMLFASQARLAENQSKRTLLGSIGSLSYEIYLFHAFIFLVLMELLPQWTGWTAYIMFAVIVAATYGICKLIAKSFSTPINRAIRARLLPRSIGSSL